MSYSASLIVSPFAPTLVRASSDDLTESDEQATEETEEEGGEGNEEEESQDEFSLDMSGDEGARPFSSEEEEDELVEKRTPGDEDVNSL